MEFFEFILVLSITVILPLGILKAVLDYKQQQREFEREKGGEGVTAGELRSLLTDAVREANAPLLARIDALENRVLDDRLLEERVAPGEGRELLDDVDTYESRDAESGAEKSVGRRVSA